jgi:thiol:disulfide interchange protein DsbD
MRLQATHWIGLSIAVVMVLTGPGVLGAQDPDPFAIGSKPQLSAGAAKDPTADRIDFVVEVAPRSARRGQTVRVTIRGRLKPGFHTYPLTERSADTAQDLSQLSQLTYQASNDLQPLWPIVESSPEFEYVQGVGAFLEHRGDFTWAQDLLIMPSASPGVHSLDMTVQLQVCDRTCVRGKRVLTAQVNVSDAPPLPLTAELRQRLAQPTPEVKVIAVPPNDPSSTNAQEKPPEHAGSGSPEALAPTTRTDRGLLAVILTSAAAAIAMLLTPCVFPMIPITVSFFLKQSEKKDHNALLTAAVYSLTIIAVLTFAVLVLGKLIVTLANDAWLNIGLGGLLVFFALSLFGMYEIELPSGLARFTSSHEGHGYIGAIFMALTFTITSFTCTGPFLGPLLVVVREYQLSFTERLIGALCYSGTFASPFFLLALFPTLLKRLPKSGGWLNAVKVVMGFLEVAAATKFLANADLAWNPGNPMLFNYETVLCSWIALSLACSLYLLGLFRLPHDTPIEHIGVGRMVLASLFLGLGFYMMPALWRVTPQGLVGRGLVAFLPLDTRSEVSGSGSGKSELAWHRNYEKAWELANREGKLIFIDFTGQNCTNCRYNEKNVFPDPRVHEELSKYVLVQLYTDFVPDPSLSHHESYEEGQKNDSLRSETFGDVANPLYAVIRPAKDQPFEKSTNGNLRLKGKIIDVRKGLISHDMLADFEKFLSEPQKDGNQTTKGLEAAGQLGNS